MNYLTQKSIAENNRVFIRDIAIDNSKVLEVVNAKHKLAVARSGGLRGYQIIY